jgi:hypothetical protein
VADNEQKIESLSKAVKSKIKSLTNSVYVGKCTIIVEVNIGQGGIADAFISMQTKERHDIFMK